ncbi:MAG: response regulator [Myxococcales bacterium]|nr:MAG: response regulator [Myxococcales bacterium]
MKHQCCDTSSTNTEDTTRKIKVLVVDDEPIQVDSLRRGLFIHQYDSAGAQGVTEALKLLESPAGREIDVLLTDLTMPGRGGLSLIERARAIKPALPVIVITGLTHTPEIEAVRQMGIPILNKPFDPDQLDRLIRRCVGGSKG